MSEQSLGSPVLKDGEVVSRILTKQGSKELQKLIDKAP